MAADNSVYAKRQSELMEQVASLVQEREVLLSALKESMLESFSGRREINSPAGISHQSQPATLGKRTPGLELSAT